MESYGCKVVSDMAAKKSASDELKTKPTAEKKVGYGDSDYEDIRIIREIMRKSAMSRPKFYVPKETQWHRFARRPEESQK